MLRAIMLARAQALCLEVILTKSKQLQIKFGERFFEDLLGKQILKETRIAIVELVANSWDSYATKVDIRLPDISAELPFVISDNGSGMTDQEFRERWATLSYNRIENQGIFAEKSPDQTDLPDRKVFGKHGKGRHAGFCFSADSFFVETAKSGKLHKYQISKSLTADKPFECVPVGDVLDATNHGTIIYASAPVQLSVSADDIRGEIGMRFLSDPNFEVSVDGEKVTFEDIPADRTTYQQIDVPGLGVIELLTIDTKESDKSTRLHGIAWQVKKRLVGEASWSSFGDEKFIDGRTTAAKRFSFIVKADCLEDKVLADWTGFDTTSGEVQSAFALVNAKIRQFLLSQSAEQRRETYEGIRSKNASVLRKMPPLSAELWSQFVQRIQEECPTLSEKELDNVSGILAKLELAQSRYGLLDKLQTYSTEDLDALDSILTDWSIQTAKIVLDELKFRLALIQELETKMNDPNTEEVKDLQPLFDRGLWIFGAEFESIEFTSNKGMTIVIDELFGQKNAQKSKNKKPPENRIRPDFVVLPDSSVSLYSRPAYSKSFEEIGPAAVVIVELKKPGVKLTDDEKTQCWKYVKLLRTKGHITAATKVDCFLLGTEISDGDAEPRYEGENQMVAIMPMLYQTVLHRAKSRTLKLYDKVKDAPFLNPEEVEDFMKGGTSDTSIQMTIDESYPNISIVPEIEKKKG